MFIGDCEAGTVNWLAEGAGKHWLARVCYGGEGGRVDFLCRFEAEFGG